MKELSIEEKAKAYDEAFEIARLVLQERERNMTDKVQKIREEVEMIVNRRLNLLNGDYFDLNKEADGFTNEIMDIIDSMQLEEIPPKFPLISQKKCMHTKDDFTDEDRNVLCDGCEEECKYAQKDEPVNKDFELALAEMIDKAQKCVVEPWVVAAQWKDELIKLAKSEEPVSEELEKAAKNHAVERYRVTRDMVLAEKCKWSFQTGAKWKEKQMMSKAVDAHVNYAWSGLSFGGFDWSKTGLDIGDKCKLIIIKED